MPPSIAFPPKGYCSLPPGTARSDTLPVAKVDGLGATGGPLAVQVYEQRLHDVFLPEGRVKIRTVQGDRTTVRFDQLQWAVEQPFTPAPPPPEPAPAEVGVAKLLASYPGIYPNLTRADYRILDPGPDFSFNCISHAVRDPSRLFRSWDREVTTDTFTNYGHLELDHCRHDVQYPGFQAALVFDQNPAGARRLLARHQHELQPAVVERAENLIETRVPETMHALRQEATSWTSKEGPSSLIELWDPSKLNGGMHGQISHLFIRPEDLHPADLPAPRVTPEA